MDRMKIDFHRLCVSVWECVRVDATRNLFVYLFTEALNVTVECVFVCVGGGRGESYQKLYYYIIISYIPCPQILLVDFIFKASSSF